MLLNANIGSGANRLQMLISKVLIFVQNLIWTLQTILKFDLIIWSENIEHVEYKHRELPNQRGQMQMLNAHLYSFFAKLNSSPYTC